MRFLTDLTHCGCSYLFELHHDVFRKLHVLEHPLQFTGERCSTFWQNTTNSPVNQSSESRFPVCYPCHYGKTDHVSALTTLIFPHLQRRSFQPTTSWPDPFCRRLQKHLFLQRQYMMTLGLPTERKSNQTETNVTADITIDESKDNHDLIQHLLQFFVCCLFVSCP